MGSPKEDITSLYTSIWTKLETLANDIQEDDWTKQAIGTKWTVGEVLTHLARFPQDLPPSVKLVRAQNGYGWIPKGLLDFGNYYAVRKYAKQTNLGQIRVELKAGLAELLTTLDSITEEEWGLPAIRTPFGRYNMQEMLETFSNEFEVHSKQIRQAL